MLASLALFLTSLAPSAAQIDPQHAMNTTVYHLNPAGAGAVPVNMDSGDARGDLYFYLGQFLLPLECANASKQQMSHFDCQNPERFGDLVVTKVDMEVDTRNTKYSACNLCNGTDPFTHKPCKVGTYVCDCFSHGGSGQCDRTKLGNESITDQFAPHATSAQCSAALTKKCGFVKNNPKTCGLCIMLQQKGLYNETCEVRDLQQFCPNPYHGCSESSPNWSCWRYNIPRKTGGHWYSTLAEGQCNEKSAAGSCGWKVLSTTTVKDSCLRSKLITRVEKESPSCFNGCGPRDTNSSCWIGCFFDTLLGPNARNSSTGNLTGLAIEEVEKAWTGSFLDEKEGGCPRVAVPQFAVERDAIVV